MSQKGNKISEIGKKTSFTTRDLTVEFFLRVIGKRIETEEDEEKREFWKARKHLFEYGLKNGIIEKSDTTVEADAKIHNYTYRNIT